MIEATKEIRLYYLKLYFLFNQIALVLKNELLLQNWIIKFTLFEVFMELGEQNKSNLITISPTHFL